MRRLVTGPLAYLGELLQSIRQGWNDFFFRPTDPTALGLIRLTTGALLLWSMLVAGFGARRFARRIRTNA